MNKITFPDNCTSLFQKVKYLFPDEQSPDNKEIRKTILNNIKDKYDTKFKTLEKGEVIDGKYQEQDIVIQYGYTVYEDNGRYLVFGITPDESIEPYYLQDIVEESDILTEDKIQKIIASFNPPTITDEEGKEVIDNRPATEVWQGVITPILQGNTHSMTSITSVENRFREAIFNKIFKDKIGQFEYIYSVKDEVIRLSREQKIKERDKLYAELVSKYFDILLEKEFGDIISVNREKQTYKISVKVRDLEEYNEDGTLAEDEDYENYRTNQLYSDNDAPIRLSSFAKILFHSLKGKDGSKYPYAYYVNTLASLNVANTSEFKEALLASNDDRLVILADYLYGQNGIITKGNTPKSTDAKIKGMFNPIAEDIETLIAQMAMSNKAQTSIDVEEIEGTIRVTKVAKSPAQSQEMNRIASLMVNEATRDLIEQGNYTQITQTLDLKGTDIQNQTVIGILSDLIKNNKTKNGFNWEEAVIGQKGQNNIWSNIVTEDSSQALKSLTITKKDGTQKSIWQKSSALNNLNYTVDRLRFQGENIDTKVSKLKGKVELNRFVSNPLVTKELSVDSVSYLQEGIMTGVDYLTPYSNLSEYQIVQLALKTYEKGLEDFQGDIVLQSITQSDQSNPIASRFKLGDKFGKPITNSDGTIMSFNPNNTESIRAFTLRNTFDAERSYWERTLTNMFTALDMKPTIKEGKFDFMGNIETLSTLMDVPTNIPVSRLEAIVGRNYITYSDKTKTQFKLHPELVTYLNSLETLDTYSASVDKGWTETKTILDNKYKGKFTTVEEDNLKRMHYYHNYIDKVVNNILTGDLFSYKGGDLFAKTVERYKRSKQGGGIGLVATDYGYGNYVPTVVLGSFSASKWFKETLKTEGTKITDTFGNEIKDFKQLDGQSFMTEIHFRMMRQSFGGNFQDYFNDGLDIKPVVDGLIGNDRVFQKDSSLVMRASVYNLSTKMGKALYQLMYSPKHIFNLSLLNQSRGNSTNLEYIVYNTIKDKNKANDVITTIQNKSYNRAWELLVDINTALGYDTVNEIGSEAEELLYYLTIGLYLSGDTTIKEEAFIQLPNLENMKANNGIEMLDLDSIVKDDYTIDTDVLDNYNYLNVPIENIKVQLSANHDISHSSISLMTQAVNAVGLQGNWKDGFDVKNTVDLLTKELENSIPLLQGFDQKELKKELQKILLETVADRDNLLQINEILASETGDIVFLPYFVNLLSNKLNTYINRAIKPKLKGDLFVLRAGTNMIEIFEWVEDGVVKTGVYTDYKEAQKRGAGEAVRRTLNNDSIVDKTTKQPIVNQGMTEEQWLDYLRINNDNFEIKPFEVVIPNVYKKELPFIQQLGLDATVDEIKQWYVNKDKYKPISTKTSGETDIETIQTIEDGLLFFTDNKQKAIKELIQRYDAGETSVITELNNYYAEFKIPKNQDAFYNSIALKKYNQLQSIKTIIVNRIPTTGKHSSALCKVVGFHNDNSNTIFVPDGLLYVQGADLDIDKGVTLLRDLSTNPDKAEKVRLSNQLLDNMLGVLDKPKNYFESHNPVSTDQMLAIKKETLEMIESKSKEEEKAGIVGEWTKKALYYAVSPFRTLFGMFQGNLWNGGGKTQVGIYANAQKVYNNLYLVASQIVDKYSPSFYDWDTTTEEQGVRTLNIVGDGKDNKGNIEAQKELSAIMPKFEFTSPELKVGNESGVYNTLGNIFKPRALKQVWSNLSDGTNNATDNAKNLGLEFAGSTHLSAPHIASLLMAGDKEGNPIDFNVIKFFQNPIVISLLNGETPQGDAKTIAMYKKDFDQIDEWTQYTNKLAKILKINQGAPFQSADIAFNLKQYDDFVNDTEGQYSVKQLIEALPDFKGYYDLMRKNNEEKSKIIKDVYIANKYFGNLVYNQRVNTSMKEDAKDIEGDIVKTKKDFNLLLKVATNAMVAFNKGIVKLDLDNETTATFDLTNPDDVIAFVEQFPAMLASFLGRYKMNEGEQGATYLLSKRIAFDMGEYMANGKQVKAPKITIPNANVLAPDVQLALITEYDRLGTNPATVDWYNAIYQYSLVRDGESFGKTSLTFLFSNHPKRKELATYIADIFNPDEATPDYVRPYFQEQKSRSKKTYANTQLTVEQFHAQNGEAHNKDGSVSKIQPKYDLEQKRKLQNGFEKILTKLSEWFQNKGVKTVIDTLENVKKVFISNGGSEAEFNLKYEGNKGFVKDGVVYIIKGEEEHYTKLHEYLHIFLHILKTNDLKEYQRLIRSFNGRNVKGWQTVKNSVILNYPELDGESDDFAEETFVTYIEMLAKRIEEVREDNSEAKEYRVKNTYTTLWDSIKTFFLGNSWVGRKEKVTNSYIDFSEAVLIDVLKTFNNAIREYQGIDIDLSSMGVKESRTEKAISRFTSQQFLYNEPNYLLEKEKYLNSLDPKYDSNKELIDKLKRNNEPSSIKIILEDAGLISPNPTKLAKKLFANPPKNEKDAERIQRIFNHSTGQIVVQEELFESSDSRFSDILYTVKMLDGKPHIDLIGCLGVSPLYKSKGALTQFSGFNSPFQNNPKDAKFIELSLFAIILKQKYPDAVFGTMKVAQIANNLDKAEQVHIKDANQTIREFQQLGKNNKNEYRDEFILALKDNDLIQGVKSIKLSNTDYVSLYKQEFEQLGVELDKTSDKLSYVKKRKAEIRANINGFRDNPEYILLSKIEAELIGIDTHNNKVITTLSQWFKSPSDFTNDLVQYAINATKKAFDNITREYDKYKRSGQDKTKKLIDALREELPELKFGTIKGYRDYYKHLWETDTNGVRTGRLINPITSPTVNPEMWRKKWSVLLNNADIKAYIEWYKDTLATYKQRMFEREGVKSPVQLVGDEYFVPLINAKWSQQLFQNGKFVKAFTEATAVINDYDRVSGKRPMTDNIDKDLSNHFLGQSVSKNVYFEKLGLQRVSNNDYVVNSKDSNEDIELHLENIIDLFAMTEIKQGELYKVAEIYDTVITMLKAENNPDLEPTIKFFEDQYQRVILNEKKVSDSALDRIASAIGGATTYLGIGFNLKSAFQQFATGQWGLWNNGFQNILGVENAVSFNNYWKASSLMFRASGGNVKSTLGRLFGWSQETKGIAEKIDLVSKHFRLLDMDYSRVTGNQYALTGSFFADMPYMGQTAGDYWNKMTYFIAKMIEDGTWDAYSVVNGELVYNEDLDPRLKGDKGKMLREFLIENGVEVKDNKLKDGYSYQMSNKYRRLADQLFGTFSKEDQSNLNSYALYRLVLSFRRWVVPKIMKYWNGKTFDNKELGNTVERDGKMVWEGTYSEGIMYSVGAMFYNVHKALKEDGIKGITSLKAWNELNKQQQDNVKKAFVDFMMFATLISTMMMIEEDPEERRRKKGIWNYIYGITSDYTIALDPSAPMQILKSPLSMITYMEKIWSLITFGIFSAMEGVTGFDILTDEQVKRRMNSAVNFGGMFLPFYKDYTFYQELNKDED